MNNVVYGKTMENLRNRIDVELVSNEDCVKWTSKPSNMSHYMDTIVAIRNFKVTLTLNKPAYVGMYILDFSKVLIYEMYTQFRSWHGHLKSRGYFSQVVQVELWTFARTC